MEDAPAEVVAVAPDEPAATHRFVIRATLWLLAAISVAIVLVPLLPGLFEGKDLARGKSWRASSALAVCHPEKIQCGDGRTAVFFHTRQEDQPWMEIDLGAPTRFSAVAVYNRRDGAPDILDRAVPLILEVGDDQQTWRTLGQINQSFSVWKPSFEPTTARYVRTRSPRNTWLHLDAVRVYP
jgi:hypothetical protein